MTATAYQIMDGFPSVCGAGEAAVKPANPHSKGLAGFFSKLKVLDLFSGIGGFSLGLERTGGFETVAFCEIDARARKVLGRHWPTVPCYNDVRHLSAATLSSDGIANIDVISGGFPCQDVSIAGKRAGLTDETRSGLWSEIARLADDLVPDYIVVENVTNLLAGPDDKPGAWFGRVLGDLAALGYHAEWHCIPASYIGAWHRRDRVWLLAYPDRIVRQQGLTEEPILRQSDLHVQSTRSFAGWPGRSNLPEPRTCGSDDGVSARLHALGNSVVPQVVELIGRAILQSLHHPDRQGSEANSLAAAGGDRPFIHEVQHAR